MMDNRPGRNTLRALAYGLIAVAGGAVYGGQV